MIPNVVWNLTIYHSYNGPISPIEVETMKTSWKLVEEDTQEAKNDGCLMKNIPRRQFHNVTKF